MLDASLFFFCGPYGTGCREVVEVSCRSIYAIGQNRPKHSYSSAGRKRANEIKNE
jgi:hypothetical protein